MLPFVFFGWCENLMLELKSSQLSIVWMCVQCNDFSVGFISIWLCKCWSKFKLCRIVIMTLMTYKFYQFTALNAKFLAADCTHLDRYSKLNMWKALTNLQKKFISIKPPFICLCFFVRESVFSRSQFRFISNNFVLCEYICILWQEPPTLTTFQLQKKSKTEIDYTILLLCGFVSL